MVQLSADASAKSDDGTIADARGGIAVDLKVEYFTDPLCCWSWALDPVWTLARQRHGARLSITTVLAGMVESWTSFRDPLNAVARPAQMAPLWHLAGTTTGIPIDPSIWHVDPPGSSYPASVAVKAAALQGDDIGEQYLAFTREAVMTRRLNIARRDVLMQLAAELNSRHPGRLDLARFERDLGGDAAIEAFRADLQRTRYLGIGRFPSMIVRGRAGSRIAVGYRPIEALEAIFAAVDSATSPSARPSGDAA